RETCHEVLKELGTKDDLLQVAMELEHIALNDPYLQKLRSARTVMRETCHEVLKELGTKDDLLQVAMELEHIALNDP
ncbi:hypothetical protein CKQ90_34975, partial [Klebsiella pneumoniae]